MSLESLPPSQSFLQRYRHVLYWVTNIVFTGLAVYGCSISDAPIGRMIYVCTLFAVCSAPLLVLRGFNDRHGLLAIFMAMYFVNFGVADFLAMLFSQPLSTNEEMLTPAEGGILVGALLALSGYLATAAGLDRSRASAGTVAVDWPQRTVLMVGLVMTIAGTGAFAYFHLVAVTVNSNRATVNAMAAMGQGFTFIVMLGQMIRPLGLLILAYGYARYRNASWFVLVLAILFSQVVLGFLGDTKGLPLQAGMIVVLTRILVDNRLPKTWIACSAVAVALAFPVFQAYRAEVAGERGIDRAHAAQDIGKVLEIALAAKDSVNEGKSGERAQTIFERASTKWNVEQIFDHAGNDAPFKMGSTLVEMVLAFVPRLVWEGKPSIPVGQVFNHELLHGSGDTYISPSHLGELYWNFGWPGLIVGMFLIGSALGWVGVKSCLADHLSTTRLLVLLATAVSLCIQFETSIAVSYVPWMRSLVAIGLLHLLFARPLAGHPRPRPLASPAPETPAPHPLRLAVSRLPVSGAPSRPRFRNLLP